MVRNGSEILKVVDVYLNRPGHTALVDCVVVEEGRSQPFFVQLSQKDRQPLRQNQPAGVLAVNARLTAPRQVDMAQAVERDLGVKPGFRLAGEGARIRPADGLTGLERVLSGEVASR